MGVVQRHLDDGSIASASAMLPRHEPEALLAALALPRAGDVFDLDAGRWAGMPILDVHPPYVQTTYRTPRGAEVDGDLRARFGPNSQRMGVITEWVSTSCHAGTHIDALCHITTDGEWFGGHREADALGDFGARSGDAAAIAPIISRGVLIDVAAHLGGEPLDAGQAVTEDHLRSALGATGVALSPGDAVLIRTGYMAVWGGDEHRRGRHYGAGIDRGAARWLAEHQPCVVGSDTENFEQVPSADPACPLPAHVELLVQRGIHIIEMLYLEALGRAKAYEFLFVCLPLRLRGATGSMVRPVAIT